MSEAKAPLASSATLLKFGWALLVIGTIVGSVGGARLPKADVMLSGIGVGTVFAGAVVLFLLRRRAGVTASDQPEVLATMRALPDELESLAKRAPALPLIDIASRIGQLDRSHFRVIAEGAPRMLSVLGVARYADVFGTYASGERCIARAWSAASDHHRSETLAGLEAGAARIRDAVARLDAA
jgi:uncharacterized protein YjeT (DUF2065 family)